MGRTCDARVVHVTPTTNVDVEIVMDGLETVRDGRSSRSVVAEVRPVVQASKHIVGAVLGGLEGTVQDAVPYISDTCTKSVRCTLTS